MNLENMKYLTPSILRLLLICSIVGFLPSLSLAKHHQRDKAITRLLSLQSEAWNRGDLEGFMQTYLQSDSLLFVGKNGPTYGWLNTLNNYRKNYNSPGKMGTLSFTPLKIKGLGRKYCLLLGRWDLHRAAGDVGGYFTITLQKFRAGWKIISDHSS